MQIKISKRHKQFPENRAKYIDCRSIKEEMTDHSNGIDDYPYRLYHLKFFKPNIGFANTIYTWCWKSRHGELLKLLPTFWSSLD